MNVGVSSGCSAGSYPGEVPRVATPSCGSLGRHRFECSEESSGVDNGGRRVIEDRQWHPTRSEVLIADKWHPISCSTTMKGHRGSMVRGRFVFEGGRINGGFGGSSSSGEGLEGVEDGILKGFGDNFPGSVIRKPWLHQMSPL
ncbi:hypothetical protein U1Q18_009730 [Sarracenia purpurea var. burkii]